MPITPQIVDLQVGVRGGSEVRMVMDLSLPAKCQGGHCLSLKYRVAVSGIVTA